MKKFKIIIPSLIFALLFTGCFQNPKAVLKEASEKMRELENYHMTMDMQMKFDMAGISMDMSGVMESDVDEKNGVSSSNMTVSVLGESQTQKSYVTYQNGKATTYTEEEGLWYKEITEVESSNIDFNIFSDVEKIEKVKGEKNTYKISLTEEEVKKLMGNVDSVGEDSKIDVDNLVVTVSVDKGYISSIVMEMPMTGESEGISMNIDAKITFSFSKFNEISNIAIPNDVLENAIDKTIYDIQVYADDYIAAIESQSIDKEVYIYEDTTLNYDGPTPSRVQVNIKEGLVTDGIIDIEGYRVTIFDGQISNIIRID